MTRYVLIEEYPNSPKLGTVFYETSVSKDYSIYPKFWKKESSFDLGVKVKNYKSSGVIVTEVKADSLAFKLGLKQNDVIIEINKKKINNINSLRTTFFKEFESIKIIK